MKETPKALKAFNDYAAMGEQRSLVALLNRYQTETDPPTKRLPTLADWSRNFGWQQRLSAIAEREKQAIVKRGIAERQSRVDILSRTVDRLASLMDARAADPDNKAAGHDTGLVLVKDVAFVSNDDGEEVARVEKYATDGVVLKEMREYLKQAAIEVGEWTEKKEVNAKLNLGSLTDEELGILEQLVRKTADT